MIRKISSLLILTLATWLNAQERPVAFVDVTVVPMDKEQTLPHQTVVVVGGRITQVASAVSPKVPHGALKIDGRGKFLMPGLADMHVHFIRPAAAGQFQPSASNGRSREPSPCLALRGEWHNHSPKYVGRSCYRRLCERGRIGPRPWA